VRNFAKPILLGAGILVLGYLLAILGLNIYLQSKTVQLRIREAASSAAGRPIAIQSTHYTPWSGFFMSGISTARVEGSPLPPAFEAASLNFRFALLQLLRGKLVIKEVIVNHPAVIVMSPPDRRGPPAGIAAPAAPPPSATPAEVQPVEGGVEIAIPIQPEPAAPKAKVEVRLVSVRDGQARFYDSKGGLVVQLEGCDVFTELVPGEGLRGRFSIAEAAVGRLAHPRKIAGTFTWKDGVLTIPDLTGEWSGGQLAGAFLLDPRRQFSADLSADGVLLKSLVRDAGISADGVKGSLFAKGHLEGAPGNPATFLGGANFALKEARFQPVDFIRQIGELMNIRELQMLELRAAEAGFSVREEEVRVESLLLESENLFVDASGPVQFDGKMKLRANLHLNEKLRNDLRGLLSDKFQDSTRAGYRQIPFTVGGSLSRPRTDLLDRLTGFRIGQDVGGLIRNLLRAPVPQTKKPAAPGESD